MRRNRIATTVATVVAFLAFACTCGAAGPDSQPAAAGGDWPQWRGPNRDGVVVNTPKLLASWPKDGPPLLWKSEWIPSYCDGGCGGPVVADGKVFVYVNKQAVGGGNSYKFITTEVLANAGWSADLPDELARKIEEAWASAKRPSSERAWWDIEQSKKEGLDAYLAKKPELDKYIKDFMATLSPQDAQKYGDHIRRRLCVYKGPGKWGMDCGFTWDELAKLSKLGDVGHGSCGEWETALQKVSNRQYLSHHFYFSPFFEYVWRRAFTWSDTILCLDAATGKTIWKKDFPVDGALLKDTREVAWWVFDKLGASGTPAVWGGKCYAVGSMGLYCLSAKEGSLLWKVKGGPEHASPLVAGGIVYHCGSAYNAETGNLLWKNPLWGAQHGKYGWIARYGSPILWTSGGKHYVITTDGDTSYCCLDLETGKDLWALKIGLDLSPTIHDDILVSPFGENSPITQAYKITPNGTELFWKGHFAAGGLIYQDHLYGGWGTCADVKTGEVNWKVKDPGSALILADGKIFGALSGDPGGYQGCPFVMFKATPEKYVRLGGFNPHACVMCSPALAGGKLYARLTDCAACYDLQDHGVYLDGVTAGKDALTFRFKQTGGGLVAKEAAGGVMITDATGVAKAAKATINGDNIVVDIKGVAVPFGISCGATNSFTGKNGLPAPPFSWNEARVLKYRKCFDNTIMLTSDIPLQQVGIWNKAETFDVAGAKVTRVALDPTGRGVSLTTDKTWKPGDALTLTHPCFSVDQGDAQREKLTATVVEVQRAAAKFVRTDETTSGTWKGVYGAEGAVIAGDPGRTAAPKCAVVAPRNKEDSVPWPDGSPETSQLQLSGDNKGRSGTCWFASDQIFIDIEITDGKEHQAALYFKKGGSKAVEVQDADTKAVLDTQSVKKAKEDLVGKYLVWNLKGNVTLHVSSTAESAEGEQIWVGGLFIDPPARPDK